MRAFVAVDLPPSMVRVLTHAQSHLRTGRIVPEENLHLTLSFLGDVGEEALEELHDALEALRPGVLEISITGLDIFGDRTAPRLVCALIDDTPALSDLHKQVTRAARAAGIPLERRRFRPHVTLARFGRTARADGAALERFLADHAALTLPPERAMSFGLYASTLRPGGAEYDALSSYPLV